MARGYRKDTKLSPIITRGEATAHGGKDYLDREDGGSKKNVRWGSVAKGIRTRQVFIGPAEGNREGRRGQRDRTAGRYHTGGFAVVTARAFGRTGIRVSASSSIMRRMPGRHISRFISGRSGGMMIGVCVGHGGLNGRFGTSNLCAWYFGARPRRERQDHYQKVSYVFVHKFHCRKPSRFGGTVQLSGSGENDW